MAKNTGKIGKLVASIVELFDRTIKVDDKNKNIYLNDEDNLYPNRIELVERNSITAFSASQKLKSFIVGLGFKEKDLNKVIVNKQKKMTLYKFLQLWANSIKTHRGAYIHVNYDIEGKVNSLDVLNFKKCRVSKEDAFGYSGLIYYKDWNKKANGVFKRSDKEVRWFYPYNKDLSVINDQRAKDFKGEKDPLKLVENYRGQVLFMNLDDTEVYPYAWLHPTYNDADNEYRISLYRNNQLRSGFLGKTVVIGNGIPEEDQEDFNNNIKSWLGSENSGSVFVITPKEGVDDPDKIITTVELKGNYDSKRFDKDEKSIANNIRKAYLSIPNILIEPQDSFFGASGEAFQKAIEYYNDETQFLRDLIKQQLEEFLPGKDYTIQPFKKREDVV